MRSLAKCEVKMREEGEEEEMEGRRISEVPTKDDE